MRRLPCLLLVLSIAAHAQDADAGSEVADAGVRTEAPIATPAAAPVAKKDAPVAEEPVTEPLDINWAPVSIPLTLFAPGAGQVLRGDKQLGGYMIAASGGFAALMMGAGVFLTASGASDASAAIGVPVIIVAAGGYSSLVAADIIGAFSNETDPLPPSLKRDVWSAPWRFGIGLTAAPRDRLQTTPEYELHGSYRGELFMLNAQASLTNTQSGSLLAGGGVRIFNYMKAEPRAGLWLEASVKQSWVRDLGFDATRVRARLVSAHPMGLISPRFGRVYSQISLGLDPTWWTPRIRGAKSSFELPVTGGFDLRWDATDWLRIFTGYEHARDELSGGVYVGFLGTFYGGLELTLTPLHTQMLGDVVLGNKFSGGNPASWTTYIEVRP